jgi:hypothetical protein
MILELIEDFTKLAVIVAGLYLVLGAYARHQRPTWSAPIEKRRLVILFALVLVVSAMKVSEDVLRGESGPVDQAILMFVHRHAPTALQGFFEAVTFTGSSRFLFPLATAVTIALLLFGRRFEALLIATSAVGGAIVVTSSRRSRAGAAELWNRTVLGLQLSQRPYARRGGFATAAVLCVGRIRPAARGFALSLAFAGSFSSPFRGWCLACIGLPMYWRACIGAFLPLAMWIALEQ